MIAISDPTLVEEGPYLRLPALAAYSSLSVRTLQRAIADADHPLPARHYGRIVLVSRPAFDRWLAERETRAAHPGAGTGLSGDRLRDAMALRGYPVPPRSRGSR